MPPAPPTPKETLACLVRPFQWPDWSALWELRCHQLAEDGVCIEDPLPVQPDLSSPYERDYHRIEQVYFARRGGFWIAWLADLPVGHVGAEDRGHHVELRRMYVRRENRGRGIGTQLVQGLIDHCIANQVPSVQLWTAPDGPGRFLYEKMGFRQIALPDSTLEGNTNEPEIRMRADLVKLLR